MLLEIILALLLGVSFGTLTGLTPGIHINLIAAIILSIYLTLLKAISPLTLSVFIISMAITHTFIDFIPSIFLGAPDEDSILSVLPGHKMLLKGLAFHAVVFTIYGSAAALLMIFLLTPVFIFLLPKIYVHIQAIMPIILILASGFLIFTEKSKRLWALTIFLLAGFLGIAVLNLPINHPLLPLLTGLFGASNLALSVHQKTKIPNQKTTSLKNIRLSKKSFLKASFASLIASPLTTFLPGLGAAQAAVIGSEVLGKDELNQKEFLFLLGAINTIVMGLSFVTLYSINRTRTGAAVTISQLLPQLKTSYLILILATILFSGIISFFLTIKLAKLTAKKIHKIKYSKLSLIILVVLTTLTIYFTGILGLMVFTISAFLGIFAILIGIRRMHLMGCLLVPTILFYL